MRFLIVIALLTGAAFVYWTANEDSDISWRTRAKQRQTPGPFPSDWFMLQRVWPDQQIAMEDYTAAAETAQRFPRRTLDEDPPWTAVGPNNIGGRIADIVADPANPNIFYVAAASGGIFKTTNGGQTWQPVFDQAPGLSMGALAIDPAHPDTVFAGTGEPCSAGYSYFGTGMYRSTDAGVSWTQIGLADSRYIARIVLEPGNPQSIWVAAMGELYGESTERGVYHTTDGGTSWQRMLYVNDSTGASDVVIHPQNPQIVYAAMWERIRSPQVRMSGGRGSGIFRTTDGGQNWQRLTDGLPPVGETVGRIGLAISESNPSILYAIYADHPGWFLGSYRSSDGGETWTRTNDGALNGLYSNFGWYFGVIKVRPDNPNVVFALGVDLARSTNGGQSWSIIATNVHVDHHALWFNPAQPQQILLGNDGGMYRSTNNGSSWTFLTGLPVNQFYAATVDYQHPERRYGGTQDQGTLRTISGNPNEWENIHGGDGFYVLVDPTNSNTIFAEYQWGWLERSLDGGETFETILDGVDGSDRTNWSTPVVMDPNNPQIMYYGSERLYKSYSGGTWWISISPELTGTGGVGNITFGTITTIGVSRVNPDVIYVGTDDAHLWVTRNGGTNWTLRNAGLPSRWITRVAPDPFEESSAYVTISGFRNVEQNAHVFRSTDFGQTWLNISGDLPVGPLNCIVPDPAIPQRLYAASDFGVFATANLGIQWTAMSRDLPRVPVIDLVLHQPTRQLTAATYGRSMYTCNLDLLAMNRPPVITYFSPANFDTLSELMGILFTVEAQDPDTDALVYHWMRNGQVVDSGMSVRLDFTQANANEQVIADVFDGEAHTQHVWTFFVSGSQAAQYPATVPLQFGLSVYPNPFNSAASIRFDIPAAARIDLSVFDISGRRVTTLIKGRQPAGQGRILWRADAVPSGTYFVRLSSDRIHLVQKTLLIR